ncbi:DUF1642 domain-containing protein [Pediococcus pentosaceus]|uniref:DUF1642 domain-containing protein n=1 Tax=Pediococcus pentosaceus TaxID=1255 RepID=UPI001328A279|nr:DUF1642 domain-containing protein [Pediococcus pentosaceus]KAF0524165.1 DUF1642 domain-containing protein [Pediococcus pentosaceus]
MSAKFGFDMEDTSEFSELMKQLDEPKKVVIPEFIANDIKYHKKHGYTLLGALGSTFDQRLESDVYCWFFADDGSVKKYINAWNNGYEVKKEPKYYVQIKGFDDFIDLKYVNYRTSDNTFGLDSKLESSNIKAAFTKSWLKDNWSEYDVYNNAGLLEFEEVEDD